MVVLVAPELWTGEVIEITSVYVQSCGFVDSSDVVAEAQSYGWSSWEDEHE
jgi:hypothetical protein